jgi:hypothetical protein
VLKKKIVTKCIPLFAVVKLKHDSDLNTDRPNFELKNIGLYKDVI